MKRFRQAAQTSCLLILAGSLLLVAGCTDKKANPADAGAPLGSSRAYIVLDALLERHPLQEDARRLLEAQQRLERLSRDRHPLEEKTGTTLGGNGYVLPALPAVGAGTGGGSATDAALRAGANEQIASFLQNLEMRQKRVLEQRRAELETRNRFDQAARERAARESADATTREQLEAVALTLLNLEIKRNVLIRDLETLPPILDEEALENEIKALNAKPEMPGISDRARLEARRRAVIGRLDPLLARIARIEEQGSNAAAEAVALAQARGAAEIEKELDALREDVETLGFAQSQKDTVQRTLNEAAKIAETVRRNASGLAMSNRENAAAGAFTVQAPLLSGASSQATDVRSAAERVARQRERLLRFIRADVAAQVRDAAAVRRIDVYIVEGAGASASAEPPDDLLERQDMTGRFAEWISAGPSWGKGGRRL